MMKRITWVSDISDPDQRGVQYVNVAFDDDDTGYIGKKLGINEVHDILEGLKGTEAEFGLESTGKKNKKNGDRWKLVSFPGYEAPDVRAGNSARLVEPATPKDLKPTATAATPALTPYDANRDESIRRAVAIKAAAIYAQGSGYDMLFEVADAIEAWLTERPGRSHGALSTPFGHTGDPDPSFPSEANSNALTDGRTGTEGNVDVGGGSNLEPAGKGKVSEPPASRCTHSDRVSELSPQGRPLPKGRLRCETCNVVLHETVFV